jgi:hypothetical protein
MLDYKSPDELPSIWSSIWSRPGKYSLGFGILELLWAIFVSIAAYSASSGARVDKVRDSLLFLIIDLPAIIAIWLGVRARLASSRQRPKNDRTFGLIGLILGAGWIILSIVWWWNAVVVNPYPNWID